MSSIDDLFLKIAQPEIDLHAGSLFSCGLFVKSHIVICFFRFRKNFSQLLEEDAINNPDAPNYLSAQAPVSTKPKRHLCSVCGYISNSYCPSCGIRYCSLKCCDTNGETQRLFPLPVIFVDRKVICRQIISSNYNLAKIRAVSVSCDFRGLEDNLRA